MLEVVDAVPGARIRQFGGLEFLAHVAGAQAEVETAVAEQVHAGDVAGQQGRLVEAGIETYVPTRMCVVTCATAVNTGNGAGAPRWSGT